MHVFFNMVAHLNNELDLLPQRQSLIITIQSKRELMLRRFFFLSFLISWRLCKVMQMAMIRKGEYLLDCIGKDFRLKKKKKKIILAVL